ncbi:MAG TPA: response regulator [Gemmataceae bacterium]|nr:response regulator [Gemmataceae bacterium]
MTKVLIVDDSPVDRRLAGRLLERSSEPTVDEDTGLTPVYASDGKEALGLIEQEHPEVVVTDLQMPGMNGLNLVLQVRVKYPLVPVILMTAHGSEELAVQALQAGAASYVPKRDLANDLLETVEGVLETARARRGHKRVLECLTDTSSHFVLDNDPTLIPPLVGYLKDNLFRMSGSDDTGLMQLTIALREGIQNAMEHGNLELDSRLREQDDGEYHRLAQERRQQKPYADRRVHVSARETPTEAVYVIRDEGPGFDPSLLPDPTDPTNIERRSGRGVLLMRTFMSEVRYNDRGNELTLIRRASDRNRGSWDLMED